MEELGSSSLHISSGMDTQILVLLNMPLHVFLK